MARLNIPTSRHDGPFTCLVDGLYCYRDALTIRNISVQMRTALSNNGDIMVNAIHKPFYRSGQITEMTSVVVKRDFAAAMYFALAIVVVLAGIVRYVTWGVEDAAWGEAQWMVVPVAVLVLAALFQGWVQRKKITDSGFRYVIKLDSSSAGQMLLLEGSELWGRLECLRQKAMEQDAKDEVTRQLLHRAFCLINNEVGGSLELGEIVLHDTHTSIIAEREVIFEEIDDLHQRQCSAIDLLCGDHKERNPLRKLLQEAQDDELERRSRHA